MEAIRERARPALSVVEGVRAALRQGQKISQSRTLRKNSTKAENVLWYHLRDNRLNGRKFRRQHTIGPFIVDFYCKELSLIVEVDGDVHAFQEARDAIREAYLEAQGYRVVRFANLDILRNLRGVLEMLGHLTKTDSEAPSP